LINKSKLDREIKEQSLRVFSLLAGAEGKVHGLKPEEVHFHEIGAVDTIVDVVGSLFGLKYLGAEEIYASPLPLGSGIIKTNHDWLPLPAPAVVEILKGCASQVLSRNFTGAQRRCGELTTPTGAAIISFLSRGTEVPFPWRIEKVGYGAGSRNGEIPNLLRLFLGEREGRLRGEVISVIETNIDNMDPQAYELVMERLFKQGALDVFITNIIMKKSRPAQKLTVLAEKDKIDTLAQVVFKNTPTLGLRIYEAERRILERKIRVLKTPFGPIRVKEVIDLDGHSQRVPEADEVNRLARRHNLSFQKIYNKILDIVN
jgi:uncharacterized protein (TIGR00299 family) protein